MSASVLEDVGGQASFGVIGSRGGLLGELCHLGREFFLWKVLHPGGVVKSSDISVKNWNAIPN